MLVQNYMQNLNNLNKILVFKVIKILLLVFSCILTPNTRSLTFMILYLKPNVFNVLGKTLFFKTKLQLKMFNF